MNYTSVKNVTPMLDSVNLPIALNKEIETGRRERKKGIERGNLQWLHLTNTNSNKWENSKEKLTKDLDTSKKEHLNGKYSYEMLYGTSQRGNAN